MLAYKLYTAPNIIKLTMQESTPKHVLFTELTAKHGKVGLITLNRPESLNAISGQMILDLSDKLHSWAADASIQAVIVQSNSERAFSAGGDIKQLYLTGKANYEQYIYFFQHEYQLSKLIHNYPKPYIALLDGIAMGGGLGISLHGSHVIAAENLKLAMPENGIGLYPDVGASYFLSRCPQHLGLYLGLTGNIIGTADAIYCELVNAFIPRNKFAEFIDLVCAQDLRTKSANTISQVIRELQATPKPGELPEHIDTIKTCFGQRSVIEVFAALQQDKSAWALTQLEILKTRAPTSLKVAFKAINLGANLDISACMEMEFNLTLQMIQRDDVYEGIRAAIIDKTHDPKWQPAQLQDVPDALLDEIFKLKCKL